MSTITFTPYTGSPRSAGTPVTVTPVPGSIKYGDGDDVKGGGLIPHNLAGVARNGSCQVVLDSAGLTLTNALALVSPVGGTSDIEGAGQDSFEALVDVTISGDAVQVADISWKGTTEEA